MRTKIELRRELLEVRANLAADEVRDKSSVIIGKLKHLIDQTAAQMIHYYEPIQKLHEVDVSPLIDYWRLNAQYLTLHTSRKINGRWCTITAQGRIVHELPQYDYIIVPMIGFDTTLHRLGYGGGYYDRLLGAQQSCRKIGLCFDLGKLTWLPSGPHDVPMDVIITEQQIYLNEHPVSP